MTTPTLVVAVDLAHKSDHVVDTAMELSRQLQARVVLVHAMQLAAGIQPETVIRAPGRDSAKAADVLEADARKHTAAIVSMLSEAGVPTELVLGMTKPAELIAATAKECGALMILIGATRQTRISRLIGDGLPTRIMELCATPVLLIPANKAKAEETYSTAQFQMLAEVDG